MRAILWCTAAVLVASSASGEVPYNSDPDPNRPTLHVHPPALKPEDARPRAAAKSVINGITVVDVLFVAGFDFSGGDYGNEPAVTANPVNPDQIVLTSFSGSAWPSGNSSLFYSADRGNTWTYSLSIPPPPGTSGPGCPCDQTVDWDRDGRLYGTFLLFDSISAVYSAQTTTPTVASSWTYRVESGAAQKTNLPALAYPDQPWVWSGPLVGDPTKTGTVVAYDNFDSGYSNVETRAAASPGADPLNFIRDAATGGDGLQFNDGMNAGHRIAVAPDGKIYSLYQRLVGFPLPSGVRVVTYLLTVSTDGGQTYSVANSDHDTGAKIIADAVPSFQGNGAKVGNVNALLGGVDALSVDPTTGTVWVVYGARATSTTRDQLWLVPVTYDNGSLLVGTARAITASTTNSYLPSVAVLPNGEVGVLYLSYLSPNFSWNFLQTTNGGATISKFTTLTTFTTPIASNPATNQRIFGDYIQVRAVGCTFYGAYPARGAGAQSVNSIDPWFMRAPAATACALPALTSISPSTVCAGGPDFSLGLTGTGFAPGAIARVGGALRNTVVASPVAATASVSAADIAVSGNVSVGLIGPLPAGGLSASLPLTVTPLPGSVGSSLLAGKSGEDVQLTWAAAVDATQYRVRRCTPLGGGACTPVEVAATPSPSYFDPVLTDGNDYWYLVDAVNDCGSTP